MIISTFIWIVTFQDIMSVLEGIGLLVRYKDASSKTNFVSVAGVLPLSSTDVSLHFEINCLRKELEEVNDREAELLKALRNRPLNGGHSIAKKGAQQGEEGPAEQQANLEAIAEKPLDEPSPRLPEIKKHKPPLFNHSLKSPGTNSATGGCALVPLDLSFPLAGQGCGFEDRCFLLDLDAQWRMEEEDALRLTLAGCEDHFSSVSHMPAFCLGMA